MIYLPLARLVIWPHYCGVKVITNGTEKGDLLAPGQVDHVVSVCLKCRFQRGIIQLLHPVRDVLFYVPEDAVPSYLKSVQSL